MSVIVLCLSHQKGEKNLGKVRGREIEGDKMGSVGEICGHRLELWCSREIRQRKKREGVADIEK